MFQKLLENELVLFVLVITFALIEAVEFWVLLVVVMGIHRVGAFPLLLFRESKVFLELRLLMNIPSGQK